MSLSVGAVEGEVEAVTRLLHGNKVRTEAGMARMVVSPCSGRQWTMGQMY